RVWPLSIPLNQSAVFANQGRPGFVQPVEISKRGAGCVEQSFLCLEYLSLTVRAANLHARCLVTSWSKYLREAFAPALRARPRFFIKYSGNDKSSATRRSRFPIGKPGACLNPEQEPTDHLAPLPAAQNPNHPPRPTKLRIL